MSQDLRSIVRMFLREPGFAVVVVLTLAVGIGANTAIFSVVNSILIRPLSFKQPERLVAVNEVVPKVAQLYPILPVNLSHFFTWRQQASNLEAISLFQPASATLTGVGEPALLKGARISANLLQVLGIGPRLGRGFSESEERSGKDTVTIISHALWTQRFQSDPGVIGRKILLDGSPQIVVGVLPDGFRMPWQQGLTSKGLATFDYFRPIGYDDGDLKNRFGDMNWSVVARLRPGTSTERALSELNVIQAALGSSLPEKMELRAAVTPLQEILVGDSRRGLLVVMGAVVAALLVLCVNLANLSFARAAGRSREIAIRVAIGASRSRLIRHMLTESTLLAVAGGTAGILLAFAAVGVLVRLAPADLPRLNEVRLDGIALGFAVAVSLIAGVLFGILPAIRMARLDPQEALKSGSHANTEGVRGVWVRKSLVAAEVAFSTVLLITAGLLIRSFERLINVDRGFDVERVVAADVALPYTKYTKNEQRSEFYRRLLEKAQAMPGVQSASLVSALPLQGETWIDLVGTEHDTRPMFQRPAVNVRFISPDYFKTIGATIRGGRVFSESDRTRPVAIISQSVVQRLWPGENAIGRKMLHNEKIVEVVGVTSDLRSTSLDKDPVNMLYIPYWQRPRLSASLLVRTSIDPKSITNPIRTMVWGLDGEVPVPETRTLLEVMNKSLGQRRFNMLLVLTFAISALALASFGVYGVLAYSVARRSNEIGIRMALGANVAEVRTMVLRQGMQPVLFGLTAGVLASIALGKLLSSLLFQVSSRDPLTMIFVAAALSIVALAACLVPAFRATRVNPLTALRCE